MVFPVDHNQFTIRLENIGDRFDTKPFGLSPNQTTVTVNLTDMVHEMFHVANPTGYKINQINFTEVTLTGNQLYSQSVASKTMWRLNLTGSVYSPNYHLQALSDDLNALSLPQQYIRTFNVSISASAVIPPTPPAKSGLPGWAIALIVVGSVLVVAGISFLIYKKYQTRKTNTYLRMSNNDSAQGTGNDMD